MIKIERHAVLAQGKPIEKPALPQQVCIPLIQHIGKPAEAMVAAGDNVETGQLIGSAQAHIFARVHASISGKVSAIIDRPHPVVGSFKAIVIDSDGLDRHAHDATRNANDAEKLTSQEIRNIVFEAGIVGMGGAGFPTHIKLAPPKAVDTLIVNGAECEPFLSGDYRLMVEHAREILLGAGLVQRCLNVKNVYIAVEENKTEAIRVFNGALQGTDYQLRILESKYPQGGEKQLIKNLLKSEVPSGKLPFDLGVVVHNVATLFAIYEAVYLSKPLYERVVTVAGSCLRNPKNLLVRIGTPVKELISACAPLDEEPGKIVFGGPMMGVAQQSDQVPVIKTTTGVILFNKKEALSLDELPCIRCGACVRECPAGLMPCILNLAAEKNMWDQARAYRVMDCIECGLCNYVCPAYRRLIQSIKRAKMEVAK